MAEAGEDKEAEKQPPDGGWQPRKSPFEPVLAALLNDPLLQDVPRRPTLADVETLIGVELGSGMRLTILKMDGTSFDVAVLNNATVRDLKIAVQKKVTELEQAQMGHRHISWKHVWGNFCLAFNHQKLLDEASPLKEYGIKTNDQLQFSHHLIPREAGQHSQAKKRRFFHGLRKHATELSALSSQGLLALGALGGYKSRFAHTRNRRFMDFARTSIKINRSSLHNVSGL